MTLEQLRALLAVVDYGTFEAAAASLQVTPSAVSQRIRALESAVGQVLVRRTTPVSPTAAGEVLVRTARQMELLSADARSELGLTRGPGVCEGEGEAGSAPAAPLAVVVNADSLATWFVPVLAEAARWADAYLRLEVEDQEHTVELLRAGVVMAAVTSQAEPVAGCRVTALGAMRYRPAAAPWLAEQHGFATPGAGEAPGAAGTVGVARVPGAAGSVGAAGQAGSRRRRRSVDWAAMPPLRYNTKDDLQASYLRRHGITGAPPDRQVPSSHGFLEGVLAGVGWGLLPQAQLGRVSQCP